MRLETRKLHETDWRELCLADRLRKMVLPAPMLMFAYCLFVRGAILDGREGLYYAFQRLLSESLLSLYLIDGWLSRRGTQTVGREEEELGRAPLPDTTKTEGEPVAHSRH